MSNEIDTQNLILDLFQDLDTLYDLKIFRHPSAMEWDLVIKNENNFGISKILKDIYPYLERCSRISSLIFDRGSIMTDQIQSLDFGIDVFTDFKSLEINEGKNKYSKKKFDGSFTTNTVTLTFK